MSDEYGFKPPGSYPPGSYPPGSYPPGAYPHDPPGGSTYPPGSYPQPPPPYSPPASTYPPPPTSYPRPPSHSYPAYPAPSYPPRPPSHGYPSCPSPSYPSKPPTCVSPPRPHYPPVGGNIVTGGHKAYYWMDWTAHRMVPPTAVHGGVDKDGTQIYVGRAYHEGDWIPAKVIPEKHVAYVAHGGGEHAKDTFQVLCEQRFDWVPSSGGDIPPGAVEGGRTESGESLYIGRVWHDGAHTVGKVHPSHGCCYIPYDCREMSFTDYEILVLRM